MIKHIVLFQLKAFDNDVNKQNKLIEIKEALEALPSKISVLTSLEVGLNVNPAEKYDIALTTTVDNMDDLHAYAVHPDHVAVATIIKAVLESRACVDFDM